MEMVRIHGCFSHQGRLRATNRQAIEARVLGGLKDKLLQPQLVAKFIRSFQKEINDSRREVVHRHAELERGFKAVERKIRRVIHAIEEGLYTPAPKARLRALEASLAEVKPEPVTRLHPNIAEIYRRKVADLEAALNDENIKAEVGEILRSLIDSVSLTPALHAPDGLDAELRGDFAAILALSGNALSTGSRKKKLASAKAPGSPLSVVAGDSREACVRVTCASPRIVDESRASSRATYSGDRGRRPRKRREHAKRT
jgi:site-specific DNA recombinase